MPLAFHFNLRYRVLDMSAVLEPSKCNHRKTAANIKNAALL